MRVGVLALQGDVQEHSAILESLGAEAIALRQVGDLESIDAIVIPGGESTTISLLLKHTGLATPLQEWVNEGRPTLGTCAGLVLLASSVSDGRPDQLYLNGLDVTVQRNGFGRQQSSFEATVHAPALGGPIEAVFIRAPRVTAVGPSVEVLGVLPSTQGGEPEPVLVGQGSLIACSFHPELAHEVRVHARLLEMVGR